MTNDNYPPNITEEDIDAQFGDEQEVELETNEEENIMTRGFVGGEEEMIEGKKYIVEISVKEVTGDDDSNETSSTYEYSENTDYNEKIANFIKSLNEPF